MVKLKVGRNIIISIHAPARGATPVNHAKRLSYRNFNPRSREGSDYIPGNTHALHALFQSTRPRGERPHCCISSTFSINFNPRSREGSDGRNHGNAELVTGFQSTLPRGERHGLFSICNIITVFQSTLPRGERLAQLVYLVDGVHYFNPRSREGSDKSYSTFQPEP